MKEPAARVCAIYSRKSKFTGKGESIENQIELCRQHIGAREGASAAAAARVYEDEGFSGGNLERPQFKRMMDDARAGKLRAVAVYRLDRISRNIGDFAKLIEELERLQVSFISVKEQFDTNNPMGRAMMYIASVFSQLERETIAERIRDNMHELAKTGRWLGGVTPTGYASEQVQRVSVDGKVRKAYKLKQIPEEAELVQTIFQTFLEANSLTKTDSFLLEHGYRTKNGKAFTRFAIKNILTNPVYMMADAGAFRYLTERGVELFSLESDFDGTRGLMVYNRTLQKAGHSNQLRPMDEWIASVGSHPGLISGEAWVRAQGMLRQNRDKAFRKPRSNAALLSGVLRCGNCGDFMRPKLSKRLNAGGERIYTYLCTTKERSRSHCCAAKNAEGNLLDAAVLAEIKKLPEDDGEWRRRLAAGQKQLQGTRAGRAAELEQLCRESQEKEAQIKALVASLAKASGAAADYIIRQIDELHGQGEDLKRRIGEAERLAQSRALSDGAFAAFLKTLRSFESTLDAAPVEQKRAAIRACVEKAVWDGGEVHVYLLGSGGADAPLGEDSK